MAGLLAIPIERSTEFWTALYGESGAPERPGMLNSIVPDPALVVGQVIPQDADGMFALGVPQGNYLLCLGTTTPDGFRLRGCDATAVDGSHLQFWTWRGNWTIQRAN